MFCFCLSPNFLDHPYPYCLCPAGEGELLHGAPAEVDLCHHIPHDHLDQARKGQYHTRREEEVHPREDPRQGQGRQAHGTPPLADPVSPQRKKRGEELIQEFFNKFELARTYLFTRLNTVEITDMKYVQIHSILQNRPNQRRILLPCNDNLATFLCTKLTFLLSLYFPGSHLKGWEWTSGGRKIPALRTNYQMTTNTPSPSASIPPPQPSTTSSPPRETSAARYMLSKSDNRTVLAFHGSMCFPFFDYEIKTHGKQNVSCDLHYILFFTRVLPICL